MIRPLAISALIALAGCGVSVNPNDGVNTSCTIAISGAETASATQTCIPSAAVETGTVGFAISVQDPSRYGTLAFVGEFKTASFATGTYDATSLTSGVTTLEGSGSMPPVWEENSMPSSGTATGSFTLIIRSTGSAITESSGTVWIGSHGTLDATLPPAPGTSSTATATVHIGF